MQDTRFRKRNDSWTRPTLTVGGSLAGVPTLFQTAQTPRQPGLLRGISYWTTRDPCKTVLSLLSFCDSYSFVSFHFLPHQWQAWVRRPPHPPIQHPPPLPRFTHGGFSRSSHTSDVEIVTPAATVLGAWRYLAALWLADSVFVLRVGEAVSLIFDL